MAWESRANQRYYYRAHKVQDRVIKEYLGKGPHAKIAAHVDAQSRELQRDAIERRRREHNAVQALDAPVDSFTDTLETLTRATLVTAGYHRHHGSEWRKRRHG